MHRVRVRFEPDRFSLPPQRYTTLIPGYTRPVDQYPGASLPSPRTVLPVKPFHPYVPDEPERLRLQRYSPNHRFVFIDQSMRGPGARSRRPGSIRIRISPSLARRRDDDDVTIAPSRSSS